MKRNIACSRGNRSGAFTLIELIAIIGLIAILVVLMLPILSRAMAGAYQAKCLSNLHQIGMGIEGYVTDHDGSLPGPMNGGQTTYFNSSALATFIYPYTATGKAASSGQPTMGTLAPLFVCPAWARAVNNSPNQTSLPICYVVHNQINITVQINGKNSNFYPFGYSGATPSISPYKMAAVISQLGKKYYDYAGGPQQTFSTSQIWMITDADQLNMAYSGATWVSQLPPTPAHKTCRNSLFFDFHAAPRPTSQIP